MDIDKDAIKRVSQAKAIAGFSFRIDPEIKERFTELCKKHGFVQSDVVRILIEGFIADCEKFPPKESKQSDK